MFVKVFIGLYTVKNVTLYHIDISMQHHSNTSQLFQEMQKLAFVQSTFWKNKSIIYFGKHQCAESVLWWPQVGLYRTTSVNCRGQKTLFHQVAVLF